MFDWTTIRNHPERFLATTAWALARGYPLGRPMTPHERLAVAVIVAHPTHTLTIHSKDASCSEMTSLFRCLVKRINRGLIKRSPRQPTRLIYFATAACAQGSTRYHVHSLLWDYLHAPVLIGHCKALGLGMPRLRQLPADRTDVNYWNQVAYVMTQHEPAFGTRHHERHEPLVRSARQFMYPQDATLRAHCPQLLSALQEANDPTVSDETLCASLPKFSNNK
jgi:hypothetical protein